MVAAEPLLIGILVLLIVGFCALTYSVFKLQTHYNQLTRGADSTTLTQVLNELLGEVRAIKSNMAKLEQSTRSLAVESRGHVQNIGIVRFNPFSDTGGAQSFTMALLDGNHDGVVMTSLYARTGNRWYVKEIVRGKGKDIELSKEEMAAIHRAIQPS